MTSISSNPNIGASVTTYLADSRNEQALAGQWTAMNGETEADVAYFQQAAASLTSADALMNDYRALKVVLGAYNVSDLLSYPGLVRNLLTEDPASAGSTARKIGNASYLNFATAMNRMRNNLFGSASNVNSIVGAYELNSYEQAQGQQIPGMQNALAFRRASSSITGIDALMSNQAALTVAVAQTGVTFTVYGSMSYTQQKAFLTQNIRLSDLQNPQTVDTWAEQYLLQAVQDPTSWNTGSSNGNTVLSLFGGSSGTSVVSLFGVSSSTDPVVSLFA